MISVIMAEIDTEKKLGRVVSFMNNKGGVGKTTSAHTIGLAWARMGRKILFIDLDSQANLTSMLSDTDPLSQTWERTIEDAFIEGEGGRGLPIIHTENELIDYVPADLDLANFEKDTARHSFCELLLIDLLEKVKDDYDFVIVDCPPAIQKLSYNAMIASDYLVLVSSLDGKSYKGVQMMVQVYNEVVSNKRFNPSLKIIGLLATMYQNDKVNKYFWELFQDRFGPLLIRPYIRKSTMVNRATSFDQSIFDIDPKGRVTEDYLHVSQDLFVRIVEDMIANGDSLIVDGVAYRVKR